MNLQNTMQFPNGSNSVGHPVSYENMQHAEKVKYFNSSRNNTLKIDELEEETDAAAANKDNNLWSENAHDKQINRRQDSSLSNKSFKQNSTSQISNPSASSNILKTFLNVWDDDSPVPGLKTKDLHSSGVDNNNSKLLSTRVDNFHDVPRNNDTLSTKDRNGVFNWKANLNNMWNDSDSDSEFPISSNKATVEQSNTKTSNNSSSSVSKVMYNDFHNHPSTSANNFQLSHEVPVREIVHITNEKTRNDCKYQGASKTFSEIKHKSSNFNDVIRDVWNDSDEIKNPYNECRGISNNFTKDSDENDDLFTNRPNNILECLRNERANSSIVPSQNSKLTFLPKNECLSDKRETIKSKLNNAPSLSISLDTNKTYFDGIESCCDISSTVVDNENYLISSDGINNCQGVEQPEQFFIPIYSSEELNYSPFEQNNDSFSVFERLSPTTEDGYNNFPTDFTENKIRFDVDKMFNELENEGNDFVNETRKEPHRFGFDDGF